MANSATDPTGRSIVTQCAFKGAVEAATAGGVYNEAIFFSAFEVMQEVLMTKVLAEQEAYFVEATARKAERIADGTYQTPAAADVRSHNAAADALGDAFGATTAVGAVQVAGKQHGPLPEWLIAAAAAKNTVKVWDNRISKSGEDITQKVGKTAPWFKGVDNDEAFWPPR